ncbi:lactoylglutathione lyase [Rhizobium pusense]|uniref:lactoylglutathione lyase n=1 Tax=Agrobacterium pusense TaxID=648995 RepID=UPI00244A3A81|nr:lactoylglutathione lyase [Agrobacterium pusense]MDH2091393.1 lactoylglutathione lyase [Agrobacterium pusense]
MTISTRRYLHTMIRVKDLDESIAFYTSAFGLREFRRIVVPEGEHTLVFLGFGEKEEDGATIELTYNWGKADYEVGTGFGHVAFGVDDIYGACDQVRAIGGKVTREPGPVKFGKTRIAFVEDPNGYKIELIQLSDALEEMEEYRVAGRAS